MLWADVCGVEMAERDASRGAPIEEGLVALYAVDVTLSWQEDGEQRSESWSVRRRYSDFRNLQQGFASEKHFAEHLPAMPPRRMQLAINPVVCEERLNGLRQWLHAAISSLALGDEAPCPFPFSLSRLALFLSPPWKLKASHAQHRLAQLHCGQSGKAMLESPRSVMQDRRRVSMVCSPVPTGMREGRDERRGACVRVPPLVVEAARWIEDRIERAREQTTAQTGQVTTAAATAEADMRRLLFVSSRPPPITAMDYLLRLVRYALERKEEGLIEDVVLHSLLLLRRVDNAQTGLEMDERTAHRLLLASLLLSSKLLDDETYTNHRWAEAGGVPNSHLHGLEMALADAASYKLLVSPDEIEKLRSSFMAVVSAGTDGASVPVVATPV